MRKLTLWLFAVVMFGSTSIRAEEPTNLAAAEIQKVLRAQQDAWNRGDIEGFMDAYWRSDQTVFVGGDVRRGWKNVLDYYKTKYSDREKMGKLTFSDFEITPLAPDSALVLGSWRLDFGAKNVHGKTTLIFRHFPEGWRIVHDHSSAEP